MVDKNDKATLRMVARELDELKMFDGINFRLSKVDEIDTAVLRPLLNLQYAKLRRLGNEIKQLLKDDQ